MTAAITPQDRTALSKPMPLASLLPMSGLESLPLQLINHPRHLETALKTRVMTRIQAGQLCLVSHYPISEPPMDVLGALAKYLEAP